MTTQIQTMPQDNFVLEYLLTNYRHTAEFIHQMFGINNVWVQTLAIQDERESPWYFDFPETLMLNYNGAPNMGRELPLARNISPAIFIIKGHHAFVCRNLVPEGGYVLIIVNDNNACDEKPQGW